MSRLLFSLKWAVFAMVSLIATMFGFKLLVDGWQAIFGNSSASVLALIALLVFAFAFVAAWTFPRGPRP